jgi:hypothetical protein
MPGEFPADLRADVQAEVVRIMKLLQEAGWSVDVISWEPNWDRARERRLNFAATHKAGKRVHSTCPESSLPARLLALLVLNKTG